MTDLAFAGFGRELRVRLAEGVDAAAMAAAIALFMPRWPVRAARGGEAPDIEVSRDDEAWTVRAQSWPGGESHAGDIHNATNALAGLLIDAVLAFGMAACCLHAAAVGTGAGAVLFAGASEAGKSTLALRFAARGYRHIADDRVFLLDGGPPWRIAALGLAAKARRPLAPGAALARFVAARIALDDPAIAYLRLAEGESADFAETFPLASIVLPRRVAGQAGARVAPAAAGELARSLIEETTSPASAGVLVPALTRLAETVPGLVVRYGDGEAAVDALAEGWQPGVP